jgi:lysophospholipase L1-like esterase
MLVCDVASGGCQPFRVASAPRPAAPARFLILGDSNGNGTSANATWDGQAVQAGWTVRTAGATVATYPAGPSPSSGHMPYLIEGTDAAGGWVIRRSVNGANSGAASVDPQIANALADVATLADGTPDVIVIVLGANDVSEAESAAYPANMARMAAQLRWRWPNAHLVYCGEATDLDGVGETYERLPANRAALAALAADPYLGGSYVDGSSFALVDSIHWSAAGHASLGAAISALWGT